MIPKQLIGRSTTPTTQVTTMNTKAASKFAILLFILKSFLPGFSFGTGQDATAALPPSSSIAFDHLEENTIVFNHPANAPDSQNQRPQKSLKTNLFDLSYLGTLKSNEGEPYFLFSGRPCQNCLEDRSVFA